MHLQQTRVPAMAESVLIANLTANFHILPATVVINQPDRKRTGL
jgi:hypothetical protein